MKRFRHSFSVFFFVCTAIFFSLCFSGCQIVQLFQITPGPLETPTPRISLNQVTDIPTLPAVTPTPTPPIGDATRYVDPKDIFLEVKEEMLPGKSYEQVVIFGTVSDFNKQTDIWGYTTATGGFKIDHHSGTEFVINCDDYCFYVDARKQLLSSDSITVGSEVIVFGASAEDVTEINADLIAVHTLASEPEVRFPDVSQFPSGIIYTEYELAGFPHLNTISIQAAPVDPAAVIQPSPTADPYGGYDTGAYTYDYSYSYGYGQPTSTPNRPQRTPTPSETETPEPTPTQSLDNRLAARLNHTLANRSSYTYGAYGEQYSAYIEYDQDQNRDPEYPTRAVMNLDSNGYTFAEIWFPYVQSPLFSTWGIISWGGDWYLPLRMTVDIDPDPATVNIVYTDRTIRSQQNFDKQQGYLRSFGFSILNNKFFYFYQKENGYGISINRVDYDLGFDDIPFGYLTDYTELDPFYSDDLITFFGHRGGKWYYVELESPENVYW